MLTVSNGFQVERLSYRIWFIQNKQTKNVRLVEIFDVIKRTKIKMKATQGSKHRSSERKT